MAPRAAGSGRREGSRRIGTAKLVAIAVAVSAVCMITLTAKAVITRANCSSSPVLVNVAVSGISVEAARAKPMMPAAAAVINARGNHSAIVPSGSSPK